MADPQFVLPTTNHEDADFRLLPGSPARGAGAKTLFTPTVDIEGKPRGERPTRGAYQE